MQAGRNGIRGPKLSFGVVRSEVTKELSLKMKKMEIMDQFSSGEASPALSHSLSKHERKYVVQLTEKAIRLPVEDKN